MTTIVDANLSKISRNNSTQRGDGPYAHAIFCPHMRTKFCPHMRIKSSRLDTSPSPVFESNHKLIQVFHTVC